MLKAEPLPPDASIASTGKELRYIADYAYASSGKVPCDNSGATILEFISGTGFLLANIEIFNWGDVSLNEDMSFLFIVNDQDIAYIRIGSATQFTRSNPITMLIPPFTKFKASGINEGGSSANNLSVMLSGRVYNE